MVGIKPTAWLTWGKYFAFELHLHPDPSPPPLKHFKKRKKKFLYKAKYVIHKNHSLFISHLTRYNEKTELVSFRRPLAFTYSPVFYPDLLPVNSGASQLLRELLARLYLYKKNWMCFLVINPFFPKGVSQHSLLSSLRHFVCAVHVSVCVICIFMCMILYMLERMPVRHRGQHWNVCLSHFPASF